MEGPEPGSARGQAQRPQPGAPEAPPTPQGAPPAPRGPACPHVLGSCDLRAHPRLHPPHSTSQQYPGLHQPLPHQAMEVKPQITPNSPHSVSHQGLGHIPVAQELCQPKPIWFYPSPKPRTQLGSRAHTQTPLQPSPTQSLQASAHQQGRDTLIKNHRTRGCVSPRDRLVHIAFPSSGQLGKVWCANILFCILLKCEAMRGLMGFGLVLLLHSSLK